MIGRALLLGTGLMACAHGPAAPPRAHAPLFLATVEGMSEEQNNILESAICQGLLEGNGSEVTCPSTLRASSAVAREQAQLTGRMPDAAADPTAAVAQIDQVVSFKAEVAGGGFAGHLTLTSKSANRELAHRDFQAKTFDDLLTQAQPESKALVQ